MNRFEALFAPHMNAAYNLARWLTGNDSAAHDVVQESAYRACKYLDRFDGSNPRAWFLAIVRNESHTWLKAAMAWRWMPLDEQEVADHGESPEGLAIDAEDCAHVQAALQALAPGFREVIVLKDLQGLSYQDIARVIDVPLGTVMSRLSRARGQLREQLLRRRGHA
ncbi:MAG: sigma-70 family RNA polymerase sigma factor [Pseudomonas sp.]|uniref:sigma-70 family RNA polymerase sigma factor n=1 Tax=Pseudomonas abieticivorans TaxID=2931382 RepID=UPI0020BE36A1|nr:sigma-70 family RNA polymerase sigma factor [Pseudomonas sp. PIA16]MDE1166148.1 sigma-70 family RNA polymerase sigma factor [Pseudomonas sp.]